MLESSARLLALLGLHAVPARLDRGRSWPSGSASPTGPSARTSTGCAALGYPVDAVRGPRRALPARCRRHRCRRCCSTRTRRWPSPSGCGPRPGSPGIEETSARALAKLDSVLPHQLQRQVAALHEAVLKGPENTGSNVEDPVVDAALLTALAAAIRDHEEVRFDYRATTTDRRQVEPYRLVSWQRRWYLVARDAHTDTWAPYRRGLDELENPWGTAVSAGRRSRATTPPSCCARSRSPAGPSTPGSACDAPAEEVLARINPTVGVVETGRRRPLRPGHRRRQRRGRRGVDRHARPRLPRRGAAGVGRGPAGPSTEVCGSDPR